MNIRTAATMSVRPRKKHAKITCDENKMKLGALNKILSSVQSIEPNQTVQTAKLTKPEYKVDFADNDNHVDQLMCTAYGAHVDVNSEPRKQYGMLLRQKWEQESNFGSASSWMTMPVMATSMCRNT